MAGANDIQLLPKPTGGVQTIQDLYDLINGKTTTTSGGTTTQTTSEGISQDSMNAMLSNILSGTNGLAAISSGQRAAGGYGSSVNTMLTNDLMARAAGQVASSQKSSTVTTTKPETTQVTGGISAAGGAKSAGFLSAIKALNDTGAGSWLKKNLGMDSKPDTGATVTPPVVEAGTNVAVGDGTGPGQISPAMQQAADVASNTNYTSAVTNESALSDIISQGGGGSVDAAPNIVSDSGMFTSGDYASSAGGDYTGDMWLADGGIVSGNPSRRAPLGTKGNPASFADGGSVTKKSLSLLGSNQFSAVPSAEQTTAGATENGSVGPSSTVSNVSNLQSASGAVTDGAGNTVGTGGLGNIGANGLTGPNSAVADKIAGIVSGAADSVGGTVSRVASGEPTRSDMQNLSQGASILGNVIGAPALANIGNFGRVASQATERGAAETFGNVVTGGLVTAALNLKKTLENPSLEGGIDSAIGFTPLGQVANGLLGLGNLSVGTIVANAQAASDPNSPINGIAGTFDPISASVRAQQDDMKENPTEDVTQAELAAQSVSPDSNDPLGDMLGMLGLDGSPAPGDNNPNADVGSDNTTTQANSDSTAGDGIGANAGDASGYGSYSGDTAGSGTAAADGGHIEGPGSSVSDSIHAMLSDGEYVLSADVVKAIGVDKLDALQEKYHTPAAVQKLQSFGKMR